MKYAYPAGTGEVQIVLQSTAEGSASLSIKDDGIGYHRAGGPRGTGLGTRLIDAMATTLGAEITYGREGTPSGAASLCAGSNRRRCSGGPRCLPGIR